METIEKIPISLKIKDVKETLRLKTQADMDRISPLLETANALFSGKAVYQVSYIEGKFEDAVDIDGARFTSRVLRKNLDNVERVFPYVITLGNGLEKKAETCGDLLEQYYLDVIGNIAIRTARKHVEKCLREKFALTGLSYMSPGSLEDWPIVEQRNLFSILNHVTDVIGVSLTENLLMIPKKSVSGIYFPTEVTFYNCQLCPREDCPGRKARYNEKSAREFGLLK